jgi:hypothetical protein
VLGLLAGLGQQIVEGKLAFYLGISLASGGHRRGVLPCGQGLGVELARADPAKECFPLSAGEGRKFPVREVRVADLDLAVGKGADLDAVAVRERQR